MRVFGFEDNVLNRGEGMMEIEKMGEWGWVDMEREWMEDGREVWGNKRVWEL